MPMSLIIRPLQPSNEDIPYELLLLADPSKEMVDAYLINGLCYVAVVDDAIIGTFVMKPIHERTYEIVNIAVKASFQGKGIGKQLLQHACAEAARLQAKTVEIGTGNSSIQQLKLYQKCGFRIHAIDFDFFTRNYDEEIYEDGIQCRDMIRLQKKL